MSEMSYGSLLREARRLRAAVDAALAICDRHEHGATRWAEPLDIPEWIAEIRAALAPVADPDPHTTSDEETT
jgi:hypothetical protein